MFHHLIGMRMFVANPIGLMEAKHVIKILARSTLLAVVLFSCAAAAQPTKLKLAFTTSDRSDFYRAIKPFVDAVNREARGLVQIDVYFSGALGGVPGGSRALQPQFVLDGVADIALIASGQTQSRFSDDAVLELPGLFDAREATLCYTELIQAHALRGYEDFYVIGAFSTGPANINSRQRLTSLADLKGMRISATSPIEAAVLERLGASSEVLPMPQAMEEISAGSIHGTAVSPGTFALFGIGKVTNYHYLLPVGGALLPVVMNRKTFASLPEEAQSVFRKYSGEWVAARFVALWQELEKQELERIKANARRIVTVPSPADFAAAQALFQSVSDEWAAKSPRNAELLAIVEKTLTRIAFPSIESHLARSSPHGISKGTLASDSMRFARTTRWAIAPSVTRKVRADLFRRQSTDEPQGESDTRLLGQHRMAGGEDQAEQIVAEVVVEGRGGIRLLP